MRSLAAALVRSLSGRSPKQLIPYLPIFSASDRATVARMLADIKPWDAEIRSALFSLVGDIAGVRSQESGVRSKANTREWI